MSTGALLNYLKLDGGNGQTVYGEFGVVITQCNFNKGKIDSGCNQILFLMKFTVQLLVDTQQRPLWEIHSAA